MPTKKVRYTQPLFGEANAAGYLIMVPGASVLIRQNGVACSVFADSAGTTMTNPVPTGVPTGTAGVDVNGTLLVYLNPGSGYDGLATVGAAVSTFPISDVPVDASEVADSAATTTSLATKAAKASNLSDLTDVAAARTNLDVPASAAVILKSLVDAKGDLIVASGADAVARLAAGADGLVLTTDATTALGLKWAAGGGGGGGGVASVTAANGTIVIGGTATDPTVAVGTGVPQSAITNLTTDLAAKAPLADPTFTGTVTAASLTVPNTGTITAPGTGLNSERFGSAATATGSGGAAFGRAAQSAGTDSVAIGNDARATFNFCIAIGGASRANVATTCTAIGYAASATGGTGALAVGYSAIASAANSIGIGGTAAGGGSIVIGRTASVTSGQTNSIAIGYGATVPVGTFVSPAMAIGYNATALEGRGTAVGPSARAEAISSTAIGRGAIVRTSHGVAVGRGAITPTTGGMNIALGSSSAATDVWFNSGWRHKYTDATDSDTITNVPASMAVTLHGVDAFDDTDGLAVNVAGGDMRLAAGVGTGTAVGGSVVLQVAPAGGASNNTKNTLTDAVIITPQRVMRMRNAATVPTVDDAAYGQLYIEGGALKYRGGAGTVTTLAAA